ncbi:cytochrome P450 [Sesbania bispinosa]|nr:cytochrome P450 [Sesbania bispinosa]
MKLSNLLQKKKRFDVRKVNEAKLQQYAHQDGTYVRRQHLKTCRMTAAGRGTIAAAVSRAFNQMKKPPNLL